jgi:phosphohistidine phosphatase SixA
MKFLLLISALYIVQFSLTAQTPLLSGKTTIYLVRHAEKEKGDDPELTEIGKQRAGDLMRTLKSKKLQRIYVTQYRRTQMTSDSTRIQLGVDTVHYLADTTGNDLLEKIKAHNDVGKSILVIGHSNTIPVVIKKLGVHNQAISAIPDNEFDNLFVVKITKGKAVLKVKKYGAQSPKIAATQTMQPLQ